MLNVQGMSVFAPDGTPLLSEIDLALGQGEVVVLSGASGSGKSTLLRALFDPEAMLAEGFVVRHRGVSGIEGAGLVPQRGAPFDHLDVSGNLALALRASRLAPAVEHESVRTWLGRVDLDPAWANASKPTSQLSGGQAQRLAVARVLASGRSVLVMDEPSVGLDPERVASLAAQIRAACASGATVLVVTHDPTFAAEIAHDIVVLADGRAHRFDLRSLPPPATRTEDDRAHLERELRRLWSGIPHALVARPKSISGISASTRIARQLASMWVPFEVVAASISGAIHELRRHPRDFLRVGLHALRQALLRPLPFYATVSLLLGFTILYVITSFGRDLGPNAAVGVVGGMPALALAPPVSAFLFVAASSNTTNAWLGTMRLSGQITAMQALGVQRRTYLWGPVFFTLVFAYLVIALVFLAGLLVGGWALSVLQGVQGGWTILTRELVDPAPERAPYVTRAGFLAVTYAVGIAADTLAKADRPKESTDAVTAAMTSSVVVSTLWVVAFELASLFVLRSVRGEA